MTVQDLREYLDRYPSHAVIVFEPAELTLKHEGVLLAGRLVKRHGERALGMLVEAEEDADET